MFAPKIAKPEAKPTGGGAGRLAPLRGIPRNVSPSHRAISWDIGKVAFQSPFLPAAPPIRGVIQAKLLVGHAHDPLEQQADDVAEKVMHSKGASPCPKCSSPLIRHKCTACDQQKTLQRLALQPSGLVDTSTSEAPPHVHHVLRSAGRPLDTATRAFVEPRFGHDFSHVRVHDTAEAAESSQALNARAYTVGRDIVFGAGQFRPRDEAGQRLLAHELAHVVQQTGASVASVQRAPCRSAKQCGGPIKGSPGQFAVQEDAAQAALKAAATPCQSKPRHKDPATNVKAVALGSGLGVAIAPEVHGIFIDKCLAGADGQTQPCDQFAGGAPSGAPAGKLCVSVTEADEDRARALQAKPRPLSGADRRKEAEISALIQHESQHARFDTAATSIVPAAADCNTTTSVPDGTDVEFQLSEMSADLAEFDIYFKNRKADPSRASIFRMQTAEHDIATRSGESILGAIQTLQCACACNTVDTFTEKVFANASVSWTSEEKAEFQKAMTGFMPSFWPKSLQKT